MHPGIPTPDPLNVCVCAVACLFKFRVLQASGSWGAWSHSLCVFLLLPGWPCHGVTHLFLVHMLLALPPAQLEPCACLQRPASSPSSPLTTPACWAPSSMCHQMTLSLLTS